MDARAILDTLVGLAEEAGVAVRVVRAAEGEPTPRSALCRVRGRPMLVLAVGEPLDVRIEAAVAAVRAHGVGLLEGRFLPPAVRERLERPPPDGSV